MEHRQFTHCVKCGTLKANSTECQKCGAIFQKAEAAQRKYLENLEKQHAAIAAEEERKKQLPETPQKISDNKNLKTCPACGNSVSKNAENCPHCGEPISKPKKEPQRIGCVGGIFVVLVVGFIASQCDKSISPPKSTQTIATTPVAEKKETTREEKLQRCFSAWDGSHRATTSLIKKSMNDPDSYKHDETRYLDNGKNVVVMTAFRGKNAFGGMVKNSIMVSTDPDTCEVIEVLNEGK